MNEIIWEWEFVNDETLDEVSSGEILLCKKPFFMDWFEKGKTYKIDNIYEMSYLGKSERIVDIRINSSVSYPFSLDDTKISYIWEYFERI